jgi:hypothetical protein
LHSYSEPFDSTTSLEEYHCSSVQNIFNDKLPKMMLLAWMY